MNGCCVDKSCNAKTCMQLPAPQTCGDCFRFGYCTFLFQAKPTNTSCDYFPRRFVAKDVKPCP